MVPRGLPPADLRSPAGRVPRSARRPGRRPGSTTRSRVRGLSATACATPGARLGEPTSSSSCRRCRRLRLWRGAFDLIERVTLGPRRRRTRARTGPDERVRTPDGGVAAWADAHPTRSPICQRRSPAQRGRRPTLPVRGAPTRSQDLHASTIPSSLRHCTKFCSTGGLALMAAFLRALVVEMSRTVEAPPAVRAAWPRGHRLGRHRGAARWRPSSALATEVGRADDLPDRVPGLECSCGSRSPGDLTASSASWRRRRTADRAGEPSRARFGEAVRPHPRSCRML